MEILSNHLNQLFIYVLQLRLKAEHVSHELKVADESEVVVKRGVKKTRLVEGMS
jgi:hypothetical protein